MVSPDPLVASSELLIASKKAAYKKNASLYVASSVTDKILTASKIYPYRLLEFHILNS